jgi:hypothetical protein
MALSQSRNGIVEFVLRATMTIRVQSQSCFLPVLRAVKVPTEVAAGVSNHQLWIGDSLQRLGFSFYLRARRIRVMG